MKGSDHLNQSDHNSFIPRPDISSEWRELRDQWVKLSQEAKQEQNNAIAQTIISQQIHDLYSRIMELQKEEAQPANDELIRGQLLKLIHEAYAGDHGKGVLRVATNGLNGQPEKLIRVLALEEKLGMDGGNPLAGKQILRKSNFYIDNWNVLKEEDITTQNRSLSELDRKVLLEVSLKDTPLSELQSFFLQLAKKTSFKYALEVFPSDFDLSFLPKDRLFFLDSDFNKYTDSDTNYYVVPQNDGNFILFSKVVERDAAFYAKLFKELDEHNRANGYDAEEIQTQAEIIPLAGQIEPTKMFLGIVLEREYVPPEFDTGIETPFLIRDEEQPSDKEIKRLHRREAFKEWLEEQVEKEGKEKKEHNPSPFLKLLGSASREFLRNNQQKIDEVLYKTISSILNIEELWEIANNDSEVSVALLDYMITNEDKQ
jgi:hypothetical protein